MPLSTVGLIQAVLDAIGEEDNDIGGLNQTRVTALSPIATPLGPPFSWQGNDMVLTPDTSGVAIGDYIRLDEDGQAFPIIDLVTNISVKLDTSVGTPPAGPTGVPIAATFTWDGSLVVLSADTSEVGVGTWLRLDVDGQWFQISEVDTNVSVTLVNPLALTIPTGATPSSKHVNPVTSLVTASLPVETTVDWPSSGKIAVDNVVYSYGSKTLSPASLDDLSFVSRGVTKYGLTREHLERATVSDISTARSSLDLVRRAMLVDFAEGADLNALGRNLGVLRFPFLESDDTFRAVIRALAYNPKGTVFGLELLLDALLGSGNYEIFEDLINFPNTVFIKIIEGPFTSDEVEGKAYLTGDEAQQPVTDTTVDISENVVSRGTVHGVTWKDEDHLSDFRAAKPSVETLIEYIGDLGTTLWTYDGPSEAADVTVLANDQGIEISDTSAADEAKYEHIARIQPESDARLSMVTYFDSGSTFSATRYRQWGGEIRDGDFVLSWGVVDDGGSGLDLALSSGTNAAIGVLTTLNYDQYYDIEIRKIRQDRVELYVDGALVSTQPYSAFTTATTETRFAVGSHSLLNDTHVGRIKQAAYYSHTVTDYWASRGAGADLSVGVPTRIDVNIPGFFATTDVGKRLEVFSDSVLNAQGGSAKGVYEVGAYVSDEIVELVGELHTGATVNADGNPLRIRLDSAGQQFRFPEDLGKTFTISGSDQGNDGSYVIDTLLDEVSLVDLEAAATTFPTKTSVCEVTAAAFVTETGLGYRIDPAFETEASVEWEMSDAGSVSGLTLTMRQALPIASAEANRVLAVRYSNVLSAQVLLDITIINQLLQTLPSVVFSYYPFYLSDPLAFIRSYVDDVTAAGVIPEFLEEI